MRWLDGVINLMDMSLSQLQERMKDRESGVLQFMGSQRMGHSFETEQQGTGGRSLHQRPVGGGAGCHRPGDPDLSLSHHLPTSQRKS